MALCAISTPLSALEVYNNEEKGAKVEVYGNIRGYIMEGAAYRSRSITTGDNDTGIGAVTNRNWSTGWNMGLQTNSRLGAKFTIGKFLGHIELGLQEPGILGSNNDVGFRLMYGQYTFGDYGKVTFGKTNTPTVVTGFVNDVMATDNGAWGFGALPISVRKFQLQYSIFGATIALIEDNPGELTKVLASVNTTGNLRRNLMPRIALAYDYKGGSLEAKAGLSYRYINATVANGSGTNSFHILAAGKYHLLNKKLYISAIAHYGYNANEERVVGYMGGYNHAAINSYTNLALFSNINVIGVYAEGGYALNDKISLRVGAGFQTAFDKYNTANNAQTISTNITSYMVMANLPVKVNQYITLTPHIGYYGTGVSNNVSVNANNTSTDTPLSLGGFAALVRAEFNF
ncbi:hypothetical protein DCO58_06010 [Helicobacter saguini]|uniref:porin n=1 Tax=Helicobacter saguini TaxID=1548018 RepID=UPI00132248D3|nr:porin [Helicobacter saguini]MWV62105.1 hypothetical protein [Helicobacter saguini]MWV67223.1 hypothetical protein [Helicobacter saguini]MWV70874.1 hypothetical protein [Helicobacter saguini]